MHGSIKTLASILIIYCSIINLNSYKIVINKLILMIIITEIISVIAFQQGQFIAVFPEIVIPIIFIYGNNKNIIKSVCLCIFSFIITIVFEYLISYICIYIFGMNLNKSVNSMSIYLIVFVIEFTLVFAFSKFLGILINKKVKLNTMILNIKNGLLILLTLILTLTIFYTNMILQPNNGSTNKIIKINLILFFCYLIILLIIMYVLIKSITKDLEYKNKQIQFENLQQYTDSLEKIYTDMKSFRHDYINILSTMVGYIEEKDMDGLEKHFNRNILPLSKGIESNNYKLGLLKNIKLPELKGVLSSKLIRAQELGIDVLIDIPKSVEKINMDIVDLCRCIGILIDNAVEANVKCDKPSLKIAIFYGSSSIFFTIINNYSEEMPPIYKMFQKGFSTKGETRGLGLNSLKEILGKYNNITIETLNKDDEFIQNIKIDNL